MKNIFLILFSFFAFSLFSQVKLPPEIWVKAKPNSILIARNDTLAQFVPRQEVINWDSLYGKPTALDTSNSNEIQLLGLSTTTTGVRMALGNNGGYTDLVGDSIEITLNNASQIKFRRLGGSGSGGSSDGTVSNVTVAGDVTKTYTVVRSVGGNFQYVVTDRGATLAEVLADGFIKTVPDLAITDAKVATAANIATSKLALKMGNANTLAGYDGAGNWSTSGYSFGTTAGTVAQGNDSRINNGQTAFGWGNHAGLYSVLAHNHNGVYEPVIANTGVTAGSYTNSNITVNAKGQVTAASNGAGGSGTTAFAGLITDVAISSPQHTQVPIYNSSSAKWENKTLSGAFSITNAGVATMNTNSVGSGAILDGSIVDGDITNATITTAKLAVIAANRILISNGSGVVSPAVIGSGLTWDGTTLASTGGGAADNMGTGFLFQKTSVLNVQFNNTGVSNPIMRAGSGIGVTSLDGGESVEFFVDNANNVPFTPSGNTSSTNVGAAIVELQTELDNHPQINYTTTEQNTKKKWLDNKDIYTKSYSLANIAAGTTLSQNITVGAGAVLENLVSFEFRYKEGAGGFFYLQNTRRNVFGANTQYIDIKVSDTNFFIQNETTLLTNCSLTLYYTKL